jgi:hypothetical protein
MSMKIFISFANRDLKILKCFVDRILKLGLEIDSENISCSGIESSKPKTGEDFRLWIRDNIQQADIIIQLISLNYKNSEVCLNEMGASWLTKALVLPVLIHPLDFKDVGFIHNTDQMLKIDTKADLFKFADELHEISMINKIKTELFNNQINEFLKEIGDDSVFVETNVFRRSDLALNSNYDFFRNLMKPSIDINKTLLNAQPTLSDCLLIFNESYSALISSRCTTMFKNLNISIDLSKFETFDVYSANFDELINNKHQLPEGMSTLAKKNIVKSNIRFYTINFRRINEDSGTSLSIWVFINNRWVFFPTPWRMIQEYY